MWFSFIISSFETLYIYKRENQCFLEHWDLWCPRCLRSKGLFQSSSYWLSQQLSTRQPLPLWTAPSFDFAAWFSFPLSVCSARLLILKVQPQCFFPLLFPSLSFPFPLISSHFMLFFLNHLVCVPIYRQLPALCCWFQSQNPQPVPFLWRPDLASKHLPLCLGHVHVSV